jgi:hypothetical protein
MIMDMIKKQNIEGNDKVVSEIEDGSIRKTVISP